ncbi:MULTISPECIES: S8 family serine peptidase [Actinoplanes]|uniref:S8 family serine peptidase n=1 Tax=Actinoplanes TaxID=1865 RepID=UPI0005F278F8|nr:MULTISPECIES: S8 family serine peptidase [Actinoplanes]GLY06020.1 hypothetical protein Acsp01_63990 [Actinoplanes sp. NBRC 101535]
MRRFLTGSLAMVVTTAGLAAASVPAAAQPSPGTTRVVSTVLDAEGRPVISVREVSAIGVIRAMDSGAELDVPVRVTDVPTLNDKLSSKQWDLAKIKAPTAWQRSTGAGVTVAVIDTGVDKSHPDLAGKVVGGFDAITNTAGGTTDQNGHGTHVAGTIAAVTGNDLGVAGFAPDAKILAVRALGADGSGYMSDTAQGVVWAADNGATVINMSLGATKPLAALTSAIAYARGKGVTVIAAAGNERAQGSPISYPAANDGVIAVAATTAADKYATFSNNGSYVDVSAPGGNILSTYPVALTTGKNSANAYAYMDGTSMASPHVAAAAAILRAAHPALTPDQIEAILEQSSVDLGAAGFDKDYGYGRIDIDAALTAAAGPMISTSVATKTVVYGTKTVTTFKVTDGGKAASGKTASSCLQVNGGAWTCGTVTLSTTGTYAVTRVANEPFRVRVGMTGAKAVTSAYSVKAAVTAVRSAKGAITVKVTGASGQQLTVQQYVKKTWKTVRTVKAAGSQKMTGLVSGGTYRVVLASTKAVQGVTSGTVTA